MTDGNDLGRFLRAQRARIAPARVGSPPVGSWRVTGLRREDVAAPAGVSTDCYAQLEQGLEREPSTAMMDATCAAPQLGIGSRTHPYRLARSTGAAVHHTTEAVSSELRQTMDNLPNAAAYVVNSAFRVLASNRVATALIGPEQYDQPIPYLFSNPAAHRYFLDWETVARAAVTGLRLAARQKPTHPEVSALIDKLGRTSRFAAMWDDHEVARSITTHKEIHHPDVGPMNLSYQSFDVPDAPGQQLVIATAPAASSSADALALLGTLDATRNSRYPETTNGTA
ncbi:helix-turn-helix domain-containing protein [Rhodococcus fascians]|nr:helix-turn-helix domain-containing protein [Rhodococcus fascians]MBY3998503.1 helix-turn-helix domain-containing protein [Rhodococcus fascians]MBY4004503.1 helix-turn-helix domain-containing protein [Rhodococcus fascians]MBY4009316.1 helix-turn-helix domain-containing protein [Rhodococcus fascians]MBY4019710.1 helix-turn-helix domain-containing protein [Rhodococcus fascians]